MIVTAGYRPASAEQVVLAESGSALWAGRPRFKYIYDYPYVCQHVFALRVLVGRFSNLVDAMLELGRPDLWG